MTEVIDETITINGVAHDINEFDTIDETMDEFSFQFGEDAMPEHSFTYEEDNDSDQTSQKQPKKHLNQVDIRGLPVKDYLGKIQPDFSKIDQVTTDILRLEYISDIETILGAHENIKRPKVDLHAIPLDVLYSVRTTIDRRATAENYAGLYQNGVVAASGAMEFIGLWFGFKKVAGFTDGQIKSIPIYRMICVKIAVEHGGGPIETLPLPLQLGAMFCVSMATHIVVTSVVGKLKKDGRSDITSNLMRMIMRQFGGDTDETNEETDGKKKKGKKGKKGTAAQPNMLQGMMNMFGGGKEGADGGNLIGSLMKNFMPQNAPNKPQRKKQKRASVKVEELSDSEEKKSKGKKKTPKEESYSSEEENEEEAPKRRKGKKKSKAASGSPFDGIMEKILPMAASMLGGGNKRKRKPIIEE